MDPASSETDQMLPLITEVSVLARAVRLLALHGLTDVPRWAESQVITQHSVLIFCPTKRQTEVCAKSLSATLPQASSDLW
jgi:hypothetical protein